MRTLVRGAAAVLFVLAMAFGLTSMTPQSALAGTDAAQPCQFIFDDSGNVIIQQGPGNCEDVLRSGGTACQITEVTGEVLIQGPECTGQFTGGPCQVTDLNFDGQYDTFQGGCRFAGEPTQVPPTQVPPTQVPPTQVPPTDVPPTQVPGTVKPTEEPGVKPTDEPGVKPTDEPGRAEPTDESETKVEVLPATGQGQDDGNGKAATTLLLGLVGMVFALGGYALRQRHTN